MPLTLPETRASLILRLHDGADVAAWDELVELYGPVIYRLARRKGLQPADADDLVQEVLVSVSRSIEAWLEKSDRGGFRAWLFCITRNAAINFLTRTKNKALSPGGADAASLLANHADEEPDSHEFDLEYRRETFRWASRRVQEVVTDRSWQAFWRTTVEGEAVSDVARSLDMTPGSVYIARSRIMARLRELARQCEETEQ